MATAQQKHTSSGVNAKAQQQSLTFLASTSCVLLSVKAVMVF